jgi:hypothetical protein
VHFRTTIFILHSFANETSISKQEIRVERLDNTRLLESAGTPVSEPVPLRVVLGVDAPQFLELDRRQIAEGTMEALTIVFMSLVFEEHLGSGQ